MVKLNNYTTTIAADQVAKLGHCPLCPAPYHTSA